MSVQPNTQLQTMGTGNPDPVGITDGNIQQMESIFNEIQSAICDSNIAIGDAVYAVSSTHVDIAATTSGNTKAAIGIAIEAKTSGQTVRYRAFGILTGLSGLTAGRTVWLTSTGTTGNTLTNPAVTSVKELNDGKFQQVLGLALTSTIMLITVQPPLTGGAPKPKSYTVVGLPSAATAGAGSLAYVSDEAGGAVLAFSDGTNWRRVTDRAVVS